MTTTVTQPANKQLSTATNRSLVDQAQQVKTAGREGYVCLLDQRQRRDPATSHESPSCICFHHTTTDQHICELRTSTPQLTFSAHSKHVPGQRVSQEGWGDWWRGRADADFPDRQTAPGGVR